MSVITDETILASLKVVPWVNYLTTFLLISVFWMAHVRIFRRVLGADTILLWFNLFFLMFVSFLPTAAVLQNAKEVPETVVIYWLSMFFTAVSLTAISVYATYGKKLAVAAASEVDSVVVIIRSVSLAGAFLGVAGLVWVTQGLWSPLAVYIVLFINGRFGRRIAVKVVAHRHRDPVSPGVAS
ncbi:MAG: putative membrane protein [Actinomycetes bacterium]